VKLGRLRAAAIGGALSLSLLIPSHAHAAAFQIVGGVPLSTGPTPLYGDAPPQNNVVNAPGVPASGTPVFDPTGPNLTADTPWVQGGQLFANFVISYRVSWIFLGSESGFDITFHSPGLSDFTEGNQNNSAYSGGPPLSGGASQLLGVTQPHLTAQPVQFSLTWATGSVDNNNPQLGPGSGLANIIFSYAVVRDAADPLATVGVGLYLTSTPSDWIVFALNDNGGPDDNHDDFVGAAFITELHCECEEPPKTPLPAALPLFATGLGVLGLIGWRKRKRMQIA